MFLYWVLLMGLIFKPWLALVLLYLLSTAPVSRLLIRPLEHHDALQLPVADEDQGGIVLGGGLPGYSPEMPGCNGKSDKGPDRNKLKLFFRNTTFSKMQRIKEFL